MKIAVVPGSFDPVTIGHVSLIEKAAALFDRVYAVAMMNDEKTYLFSLADRGALLHEAVAHLDNVKVEQDSGLLAEYAVRKGACAVVKGIRNGKDAEYELMMAEINRQLAPGVQTVFVMSDQSLTEISATEVRRLIEEGQDVSAFVPCCVAKKIDERLMRYE